MKLSPFWKGFILVLAATILVGGVIFVNRILGGDAFNREEARHALYGAWIWSDIMAGDWSGFWYDTGRQMFWPFMHSWLLAVSFAAFGANYVSARLLSLIFLVLSVGLIYPLSSHLSEKSGWKTGILASVLMLTSPLIIRFSTQNMIEGLGAFLFLAAACFYTVCQRRKLVLYYIFLAVVIGLTIYTNYIYAYFMLSAFLVVTLGKLAPLFTRAMKLKRKGEKAAMPFIWWAYKKLIVLAVLLVFSGVWFSFNFSRRIMLLIDVILRSGVSNGLGLGESLIYYPKAIIAHLSFSPWIGILLFGSLFLPFIALHYQGLSKLYVFVWTTLILATLTIPAKTAQMIYAVVPFVFIILSATFFYFLEMLRKRDKKLALLLVLVLLLPTLVSAPKAYSLYFPARTGQNLIDVLDYFKAEVPDGSQIGTILNLKRFNSEVVQFHFRGGDSHILAEDYLSRGRVRGDDVYFLTLSLDGDSPYQKDVIDDSLYRWNSWLRRQERDGGARLYSSRRFESIGLTAGIYKNISAWK